MHIQIRFTAPVCISLLLIRSST